MLIPSIFLIDSYHSSAHLICPAAVRSMTPDLKLRCAIAIRASSMVSLYVFFPRPVGSRRRSIATHGG